MSRPMLFPVYGHTDRGVTETLAVFFTNSDATDFAQHPERDGFEKRNVYLDQPKYDQRKSGYRPAVEPSGYEEWLASLEPKHIGDGRYQVAA